MSYPKTSMASVENSYHQFSSIDSASGLMCGQRDWPVDQVNKHNRIIAVYVVFVMICVALVLFPKAACITDAGQYNLCVAWQDMRKVLCFTVGVTACCLATWRQVKPECQQLDGQSLIEEDWMRTVNRCTSIF